MKGKNHFTIKNISILFLICVFACATIHAQKRNYFLFTDKNITKLKDQIKTDPVVKKYWDEQSKKAKNLLKKSTLRAKDCKILSLVYRMTGDEQYAKAIKKILIEYTSRETWENGILLNRTPVWQAGLNTSHTSFDIAVGYDCIYHYLTTEERQTIAEGFVRVGIEPAREDWLLPSANFHTFDTMGHNWWSSCVYMAGISALVLRDEIPEAQTWVQEIAQTVTEWVSFSGSVLQNKPPTFDAEGGFYESVNYANYGISQYLLFRYALQEVWPDQTQVELPILEKIGDFFINATYYVKNDKTLTMPFGDTGMEVTGIGCLKLLWNLGHQKDRFAWYINKVNTAGNHDHLGLNAPVGLILQPDIPKLPETYLPDVPTAQVYKDMGWATFRNSWQDNATMLAIKSGFTWNHTHADAGSYVLFHEGKYLLIDSGKSSYGNPLYTEYFCQSEAHNVVLFDEKGQNRRDPYFGVVNQGSLHNLVNGKDFKYVLANATGPYSQILERNYRQFVWVGDVIVVIDDLLAHEPGKFEWLLHYNGESKRKGIDLSVKDKDAEVLIRPLYPEMFPSGGLPHDFPEQMRLQEKIGYEGHRPYGEKPYWSISHFEETIRTKFISAIILKSDTNKDNLPVIEKFDGKDFLGVSITQNGETTQLYFNLLADGRLKHRNSVINMNGWETDAYLTAVRFKENTDTSNYTNIEELFIAHGSYLRRENQTLLHSLSKFTALVEQFDEKPNLVFQGQANAKVHLYSSKNQSSVQVNNEVRKGVYDASSKLFNFRLDDSKQ